VIGGRVDRLWVVGGAIAAAVLTILTWFFLVSPQHQATGALREETLAADGQMPILHARLNELRKQNENLDEYQAQLDRDRLALPTGPAMTDYLRQLQAAGESAGVTVTGLLVGAPKAIGEANPGMYAMPITVTATGNAVALERFLNEIQQVQARAVLIASANLSAKDAGGSVVSSSTLTISLHAFVASPPGTPTKPADKPAEGTG
jgi:type IV pilus assembly protein PilO